MKTVFKVLTLTILNLLWAFQPSAAQTADASATAPDFIEVGLLTCAPGNKSYDLYGHTALRVRSLSDNRDFVFNYGIFDFSSPNFVLRWLLGETDYTIGVVPFERFAEYYAAEGRSIDEQVLNLTTEEALIVVHLLDSKVMQHGWTYRYNFLYDNCTTRAISTVEQGINGSIQWPPSKPNKTIRGIIHEYANDKMPWTAFGQDLLLGAKVDLPAARAKQMFAPLYAKDYVAGASIISHDGTRRPLVKATRTVVSATPVVSAKCPVSPLMGMWGLLLITIAVCAVEWRRGKVCHLFDGIILLLLGVLGCLVAVLFFGSSHPSVSSNWLIFLFNPLPLVYLPFKFIRLRHGKTDYAVPLIWTEVFVLILVYLISPQQIPAGIYILTAAIALRGASLFIFYMKHGWLSQRGPTLPHHN